MTNSSEKETWSTWNMNPLVGTLALQREPTVQQKAQTDQELAQQAVFQRNAEIEALRDQARKEGFDAGFDKGYEDAHVEGFAKGLVDGKEEGLSLLRDQARKTVEPLSHLAKNFTEGLTELDGRIANQVAALALKIGKLLVGKAIQDTPEQILTVVKQLMHHEPELKGRPKLHLNPEDFSIVHENLKTELEALDWTLRSDELITRGGCKVVSKSGDLDATLESRWAQINDEFNRQGVYE